MIIFLKEILIFIICLYFFLILRSHYSKGMSIKKAIGENNHLLLMVLFSRITWYALLIATVYVIYHIIH